jgi:hypothetical protein
LISTSIHITIPWSMAALWQLSFPADYGQYAPAISHSTQSTLSFRACDIAAYLPGLLCLYGYPVLIMFRLHRTILPYKPEKKNKRSMVPALNFPKCSETKAYTHILQFAGVVHIQPVAKHTGSSCTIDLSNFSVIYCTHKCRRVLRASCLD